MSFLLVGLFLGLLSAPVHAAVWYVNDTSTVGDSFSTTTGADTQPGTIAEPFLTLAKAMDSVVAGDTILLDAGIFSRRDTHAGILDSAILVIDTDNISLIGADSSSTRPVRPDPLIFRHGQRTMKCWG